MTIWQMNVSKNTQSSEEKKISPVTMVLLSLLLCVTCFFILQGCTERTVMTTLPMPDNSAHPNSVFVCYDAPSDYIYEDGDSNLWYQKGGYIYQNLKTEMPDAVVLIPGDFTMVLKNNGTVWCKGNNEFGQLGDGYNTNKDKFVRVIGLDNIVSISKGFDNAIALKSDGTVWYWGRGFFSTIPDSNTPVQVVGLTDIVSIIDCNESLIALKSDGTVWYWGSSIWDNLIGRKPAMPEKVKGLKDIVSISATDDNMTALKRNGTVMEWSLGEHGFKVAKVLKGVKSISAGISHTIALKNDGTVWCWGSNYNGELGDGTSRYHKKPVKAEGLDNIISVSAGQGFSLALKNDGTIWEWGICNPDFNSDKGNNTIPTIANYSFEFDDIIKNAKSIIDFSAPAASSAHIKGHVIVYDLKNGQLDYQTYNVLPDDLRANSIDEDITFIFKKDSRINAGSYTNNAIAYRYSVAVAVVNYSDNKFTPNKSVITLLGGDPSEMILENDTEEYGSYPDIAGWIKSQVRN